VLARRIHVGVQFYASRIRHSLLDSVLDHDMTFDVTCDVTINTTFDTTFDFWPCSTPIFEVYLQYASRVLEVLGETMIQQSDN
jgi:hypothetical protein